MTIGPLVVKYPLKISLSSGKCNVLKTYSIEDRGHLVKQLVFTRIVTEYLKMLEKFVKVCLKRSTCLNR